MSSILSSFAAVLVAQFLPGLLFVTLARLGRDRFERLVIAFVLGGPVAAAIYLVALWIGSDTAYWILLAAVGLPAIALGLRRKERLQRVPGRELALLIAMILVVLGAYGWTTGDLFRTDTSGHLVLDPALQRDTLFHVGMVRALAASWPPRLLSVGGEPVGYHVGYHLQLAARSRHFGIDAFDGLIRVGATLQLALLLASAFLLGRRFFYGRNGPALLASLLVLGAGLGFLFYARPSVDWWSLAFLDVTLVSVFLVNPLLPALPLFFVGLALVEDRAWPGAILCFCSLFAIKMFLGVQILAAVLVAAVRSKALRRFAAVYLLCSSPFLLHTLFAAGSSNTSLGIRPLEIVRYSMEKLDYPILVETLSSVGALQVSAGAWLGALAISLFWVVGFLGLRLVAIPGWFHDLRGEGLRAVMAFVVLVGFPASLLFRIAPAEAEGLSRLEAVNDVVWFAAQSGVVLWFWTAGALWRFASAGMARAVVAIVAVAVLALPGTVQHFFYKSSLAPDRMHRDVLDAAVEARALSAPEEIWLGPPDRSHASALAYVAGRPVVYDAYVGYDYMFVPRDTIDYRRHAIAQFWLSDDEAYASWFLKHFDVSWVWSRQRLRRGAGMWLEPRFENETVTLYSVRRGPDDDEIRTPSEIPVGGRGLPFLDRGWRRDARMRWLGKEVGRIYVPRPSGIEMTLRLRLATPHSGGQLTVDEELVRIAEDSQEVSVSLPPRDTSGLDVLKLRWDGASPLGVRWIEIVSA